MASPLPVPEPTRAHAPAFGAASRRGFLAGAAATGSALFLSDPAFAFPGLEERFTSLCDRLWQDHLRRFPEEATTTGADTGANLAARGRLADYSRAGRQAWIDGAADAGKRLALIESELLADAPRTTHAVLTRYTGELATLGRRWRFGDGASPVAPYALSPLNGPHTTVPALLATRHPLATAADGEAWLARLGGFASALDQATEAFRCDAAAGITAPTAALTATLAQLSELGAPEPATHPLAAALGTRTASAGLAGDWQARAAAVLAKVVYPALARQRAAISAQLARGLEGGMAALPQGRAYYADALAYHTGKPLTPAEVHRIGLAEVAEVGAEIDAVLARLAMPAGGLGARLAGLDRAPGQVFTDCAEGRTAVLQAFDKAIGRANSHLADQFDMLPPPARAVLGRTARALPTPAEPAPAGTIMIDPARLDELRRFMIPTTAFHEGMPGLSWEAAAARANPQVPPVRRHAVRYSAYTQGWALYAEHVADESGLYADDHAARVGYLRTRLLRSALLVVDTGLHDLGWSRAKAIAYLAGVTGRPAETVAPAVDRAFLLPGEACAAVIGRQEWLRLRALAQRLAGDRFDPRRFHDVIGEGRAPFEVLDERITARFNPYRSVLQARTV